MLRFGMTFLIRNFKDKKKDFEYSANMQHVASFKLVVVYGTSINEQDYGAEHGHEEAD